MKNKIFAKSSSLLLTIVLIVAMAFSFTACNDVKTEGGAISEQPSLASEEVSLEISVEESQEEVFAQSVAVEESGVSVDTEETVSYETSVAEESVSYETSAPEESVELSSAPLKNVLGEGALQFTLKVSDYDGVETTYTVKTDTKTVGDALKELNLIEGEEGAYGLYIKKVMGIRADYDLDGRYWAFYIDGSYATTGIDSTEIVNGESYALKVQK